MPVELYCYACRTSSYGINAPDGSAPLCPACNSDFVELLEPAADREQPSPAVPAAFPAQGFPLLFPMGPQEGGGPQGMAILHHLLSTLVSQGAQIAVQGPHAGPQGAFNIGDFATGGMEDLLNRLMEQHQPRNEPTARATVANLARRKVPASAEQKGEEAYASAGACKAGDTCTVCHSEFEAETEVIQLPCEHCFHPDCILPWLELHHTCPICRAELPTDDAPQAPPEGAGGGGEAGGGRTGGGPPQGRAGTTPPINDFTQALDDLATLLGSRGPGGQQDMSAWTPVELPWQARVAGTDAGSRRVAGQMVPVSDESDGSTELVGSSEDDSDLDEEYLDSEEDHESEEDSDYDEQAEDEYNSTSEWETDEEEGLEEERVQSLATRLSNLDASNQRPPREAAVQGSSQDSGNESALVSSSTLATSASSSGPAGLSEGGSPGSKEHSCEGLEKMPLEEHQGGKRGGPLGLLGAVAGPVGWLARGAWHIGSSIISRLL